MNELARAVRFLAVCILWGLVIPGFMGLAGCSLTPYAAGRHISDPGVSGDGLDLICAGIKQRGQVTIKTGYCKNIRGGNMIEASIEVDLFHE